ncbi:unnamed protein product [Amoebophrya sp. A120]|nr:unnamed protein product [Amoebophrya sp. A120]|eukprot:GSA120T00019117001.1
MMSAGATRTATKLLVFFLCGCGSQVDQVSGRMILDGALQDVDMTGTTSQDLVVAPVIDGVYHRDSSRRGRGVHRAGRLSESSDATARGLEQDAGASAFGRGSTDACDPAPADEEKMVDHDVDQPQDRRRPFVHSSSSQYFRRERLPSEEKYSQQALDDTCSIAGQYKPLGGTTCEDLATTKVPDFLLLSEPQQASSPSSGRSASETGEASAPCCRRMVNPLLGCVGHQLSDVSAREECIHSLVKTHQVPPPNSYRLVALGNALITDLVPSVLYGAAAAGAASYVADQAITRFEKVQPYLASTVGFLATQTTSGRSLRQFAMLAGGAVATAFVISPLCRACVPALAKYFGAAGAAEVGKWVMGGGALATEAFSQFFGNVQDDMTAKRAEATTNELSEALVKFLRSLEPTLLKAAGVAAGAKHLWRSPGTAFSRTCAAWHNVVSPPEVLRQTWSVTRQKERRHRELLKMGKNDPPSSRTTTRGASCASSGSFAARIARGCARRRRSKKQVDASDVADELIEQMSNMTVSAPTVVPGTQQQPPAPQEVADAAEESLVPMKEQAPASRNEPALVEAKTVESRDMVNSARGRLGGNAQRRGPSPDSGSTTAGDELSDGASIGTSPSRSVSPMPRRAGDGEEARQLHLRPLSGVREATGRSSGSPLGAGVLTPNFGAIASGMESPGQNVGSSPFSFGREPIDVQSRVLEQGGGSIPADAEADTEMRDREVEDPPRADPDESPLRQILEPSSTTGTVSVNTEDAPMVGPEDPADLADGEDNALDGEIEQREQQSPQSHAVSGDLLRRTPPSMDDDNAPVSRPRAWREVDHQDESDSEVEDHPGSSNSETEDEEIEEDFSASSNGSPATDDEDEDNHNHNFNLAFLPEVERAALKIAGFVSLSTPGRVITRAAHLRVADAVRVLLRPEEQYHQRPGSRNEPTWLKLNQPVTVAPEQNGLFGPGTARRGRGAGEDTSADGAVVFGSRTTARAQPQVASGAPMRGLSSPPLFAPPAAAAEYGPVVLYPVVADVEEEDPTTGERMVLPRPVEAAEGGYIYTVTTYQNLQLLLSQRCDAGSSCYSMQTHYLMYLLASHALANGGQEELSDYHLLVRCRLMQFFQGQGMLPWRAFGGPAPPG